MFAKLSFTAMLRAQTPYPDHSIQDVSWSSGTHHFAVVTQHIIAPGTPTLPVLITGTADAEFVSGSQVRLAPGFHAGGFNTEGRFRAYIDESLGQPADLIIIAPDPQGALVDNIVHVPKWEKFEVGLRLPQEYQDATERFFDHYYSGGVMEDATPGNVHPVYDLNPYADDSLQLVMTLTSPSGSKIKWGFFMREGRWSSEDPDAKLVEAPDDPLYPYHIRFRIAPDVEGPWRFDLAVKAPHTQTLADQALPEHDYWGYKFHCGPPVPGNRGFLKVSEANRRNLQLEDGTPFFGLGPNLADKASSDWYFLMRDYNLMKQALEDLHSMGGNFSRMYLMRSIFAPEWVNLGVYDSYRAPQICLSNPPWDLIYRGNCQYQCWAFDQLLDHIHDNGIYVQLCVDPYPPIKAYEIPIWGPHAYVLNYLNPIRDPSTGRYDLKEFFYEGGDPANKNSGVF
ncbi:MAG: hypothetical protein KIT10_09400 [Flavobacteriales bacterium]|nr:hypothetical protein [Flavobacteriales bacterium]